MLHDEIAFLGRAMTDASAVERAIHVHHLKASEFATREHGAIWAVLVQLWSTSRPIDVVQVASFMKELHPKFLGAIGGVEYLTNILNEADADSDIDKCIESIRQRSVLH